MNYHNILCDLPTIINCVLTLCVSFVSVRQFADICLFSTAQYKCTVAEAESE